MILKTSGRNYTYICSTSFYGDYFSAAKWKGKHIWKLLDRVLMRVCRGWERPLWWLASAPFLLNLHCERSSVITVSIREKEIICAYFI